MESSVYSRLAEQLGSALRLRQPAIAISFTDVIPESVEEHQGTVPAGCRFWEDAAKGTFATVVEDHAHCAIGMYTHNLAPTPAQQIDLMDALKVFGDLGYVRSEDVASIPVLERRPKHVIYGPLAETPLLPDLVLLFVDANQTLILSEATQQVEAQNPPAMGRPACAVVPQVMNTGRAALSLGCCGARAYLDMLTDDVALFAIPGAKLEAYAERIDALAKANGILASFHQIRRREIEGGGRPTVRESLVALGA